MGVTYSKGIKKLENITKKIKRRRGGSFLFCFVFISKKLSD